MSGFAPVCLVACMCMDVNVCLCLFAGGTAIG